MMIVLEMLSATHKVASASVLNPTLELTADVSVPKGKKIIRFQMLPLV